MFLQEFSLERAIDSAVGDWSEDVQPGQQAEIPCLDFWHFPKFAKTAQA